MLEPIDLKLIRVVGLLKLVLFEKKDGHYLEILFVYSNLKLLLIDFKVDRVEERTQHYFDMSRTSIELSCYIHPTFIHPVDMASTSMCYHA